MADNDKLKNPPASIVEEIEQQLEEILKNRKVDIEKELEDRIQREKDEARRRLDQVDTEMSEDRELISSYRDILSELDAEKTDIKNQIQVHLDKAVSFQAEVELKTKKTQDELHSVRELNNRLEKLSHDTNGKMQVLRQCLEDKYGIVPDLPSEMEGEDLSPRIEQELEKLQKIRELLAKEETMGGPPLDEMGSTSLEAHEDAVFEPVEEQGADRPSESDDQPSPQTDVDPAVPETDSGTDTDEEKAEVQKEDADVFVSPGIESENSAPETEVIHLETGIEGSHEADTSINEVDDEEPLQGKVSDEQPPPDKQNGIEELQTTEAELKLLNTLEKFRKSEGSGEENDIVFFENEDRVILDGEVIVASLSRHLDDARQLYLSISDTDSPKNHFFIKQDIIRQQEVIRILMLSAIRLSEIHPDFLPDYTKDILNVDLFKTVLEKVTMENWSNQIDFKGFDEFTAELKKNYYARITPPSEYLESLIKELKISG